MTGPALALLGVTKSYGARRALDRVDLTIEPGSIVGLLGPNGAGKTTLLSIASGLRRPDRGSALVGGTDVHADPKAAHRLLGLAPQDLGVYPTITTRENLRLFGALAGLRGTELDRRVEAVAASIGLLEHLARRVRDLSGGEAHRLHVAMAFVHRPSLLLLDEPTAGVDVESRLAILDIVRRSATDGNAVCYSTNNIAEVEELDGSVAILDRGRVLARGTVREVIAAHATGIAELTFEGEAPTLEDAARVEPSTLRIRHRDPGAAVARALRRLDSDASRVRSVEITRPSLETAFLALTGRRYREDEGDDDAA